MANVFPNPDTRWRKGQSGNPKGRPKGRSFKAARAFLAAAVDSNAAIADLAAQQMVLMLLRGDLRAAQMLIDAEAVELRAEERMEERRHARARGG